MKLNPSIFVLKVDNRTGEKVKLDNMKASSEGVVKDVIQAVDGFTTKVFADSVDTVTIKGKGDVEVNAINTSKVSIQGASSVKVQGDEKLEFNAVDCDEVGVESCGKVKLTNIKNKVYSFFNKGLDLENSTAIVDSHFDKDVRLVKTGEADVWMHQGDLSAENDKLNIYFNGFGGGPNEGRVMKTINRERRHYTVFEPNFLYPKTHQIGCTSHYERSPGSRRKGDIGMQGSFYRLNENNCPEKLK